MLINADDALGNYPRRRGPEPQRRDEAVEFLRHCLASGPRPARGVQNEAWETLKISKGTLKRSRKLAGVIAYREQIPGPWWLRLTPGANVNDQPAPLEPVGDCQRDLIVFNGNNI